MRVEATQTPKVPSLTSVASQTCTVAGRPASKAVQSKISLTSDAFSDDDYFNGAKYGNYCWSQTVTEIGMILRNSSQLDQKII